MAITSRDDLLFLWDQRVKPGVLPIIGGDPVFDRDSARTFIGADKKLRSAIVDTPVLEYEEVNGVVRPVLPLQLARTNLALHSEAFDNATWARRIYNNYNSMTVVADAADAPNGQVTADELTVPATTAAARQQLFTVSPSTTYTFSVYLRKIPGETIPNTFQLRFSTGNSGTMVSSGAAVMDIADGDLSETEWRRFSLTYTTPASGVDEIEAGLAYSGASETFSFLAWGGQFELGAFATSYIGPTTSAAVARAVESLHWQNPPAPQAMVAYHREVVTMPSSAWGGATERIWECSGPTSSNPRLIAYREPSAFYAYLHNGTTDRTTYVNVTAEVGDTLETLVALRGDGVLYVMARVNGGALVGPTSAAGITLPSAWYGGAETRLHQNSVEGSATGAGKYERLTMVKYASVDSDPATEAEALLDGLAAVITDTNGNPL